MENQRNQQEEMVHNKRVNKRAKPLKKGREKKQRSPV
jgi:hypothetical protein